MKCIYCETPLSIRAITCPGCGAPVSDFTGRAWLLPIVLDWLEKPNERLFILTGEPGAG